MLNHIPPYENGATGNRGLTWEMAPTSTLEFNVKGTTISGPALSANSLWLKSTWGLDGKSQYFYSTDGLSYTLFGDLYQLMWGSYRGDCLGIYSYNNKAEAGHIDVDFFHYDYSKPGGRAVNY